MRGPPTPLASPLFLQTPDSSPPRLPQPLPLHHPRPAWTLATTCPTPYLSRGAKRGALSDPPGGGVTARGGAYHEPMSTSRFWGTGQTYKQAPYSLWNCLCAASRRSGSPPALFALAQYLRTFDFEVVDDIAHRKGAWGRHLRDARGGRGVCVGRAPPAHQPGPSVLEASFLKWSVTPPPGGMGVWLVYGGWNFWASILGSPGGRVSPTLGGSIPAVPPPPRGLAATFGP